MTQYAHVYTRENSVVAMDIWHEHQTDRIVELYGRSYPPFLYDIREGVCDVYIEVNCFPEIERAFVEQAKTVPHFITNWLDRYERDLKPLETLWRESFQPRTREDLLYVCELAIQAWVGLEASYFVPGIQEDPITDADRTRAMALRERSGDFLDATDQLIIRGLRQLYPELGDLVLFIRLSELRADSLPSKEELVTRSRHCILFNDRLVVDKDLGSFAEEQDIRLVIEQVPTTRALKGQPAKEGFVRGQARVLYKKAQVPELQTGEILVTSMTTPDYLPAMKRASAFVTDEGGITCHAAIIAREFGTPCVIGTKFATKVIKTGDEIEVDATNGIVRIV